MTESSSGSSWGLGLAAAAGAGVLIFVGAQSGGSGLDDGKRLDAPLPAAAVSDVASTASLQQGLGPSSIAIPALGVTARIGAATLENGLLTPPLDPGEVGSWQGSAPLDSTSGEVTLAGHVNYGGMGAFAFGRLAELHPGEMVYTTDAHDKQTAWRIASVVGRPKAAGVDPAAFSGTSGPRELSLITCGGTYEAASHSYDNNVYVTAVPVPLS